MNFCTIFPLSYCTQYVIYIAPNIKITMEIYTSTQSMYHNVLYNVNVHPTCHFDIDYNKTIGVVVYHECIVPLYIYAYIYIYIGYIYI